MATFKATIHSFPAQPVGPATISAEQITRYLELTSLLAQAEQQQKAFRAELLSLFATGAQQEQSSPYLLNFVQQNRRAVDWKDEALKLAQKLYGIENVSKWRVHVEQSAPTQPITQIRVKPNPSYAALARNVSKKVN